MKLAFSTNAFTSYTLPESISEIGRLGYKGVEILADVPHAFPPLHTAPWVSDVQKK
jgi:fructoselysine 3-epimerase